MTEKYKSLIQLAEAFRSGELNKEHYTLILDNDGSWLDYTGPLPDGIEAGSMAAEVWRDEMCAKARKLFSGNGYSDIDDACTAAGIPCEWC